MVDKCKHILGAFTLFHHLPKVRAFHEDHQMVLWKEMIYSMLSFNRTIKNLLANELILNLNILSSYVTTQIRSQLYSTLIITKMFFGFMHRCEHIPNKSTKLRALLSSKSRSLILHFSSRKRE